jgi:tetratricopeptide (TPR) repeat protein
LAVALLAALVFGFSMPQPAHGQMPELSAAEMDDLFALAINSYQEGEFARAAASFERLASEHGPHAAYFYNAGASYSQAEQPGLAALNLRRALRLQPGLAEARELLTQLESAETARTFSHPVPATLAGLASPSFLAALGSAVFWLGALGCAAWFFFKRAHRPNASWLGPAGLAGLGLGLLLLAAAAFLWTTAYHPALSTVTGHAAEVRGEPSLSGEPLLTLAPASQVKLLEARGRWSFISLPDGQSGWVASEIIQPDMPQPGS